MSGRIEVSPHARAAFDLAFLTGDLEGVQEYGDVLTTATEIDAYQYAMAELADTAKYLTLLELRYQAVLAENAELRRQLGATRGEERTS